MSDETNAPVEQGTLPVEENPVQQELEAMRNDMRQMFLLYLDNGLAKWEMLQKEIAHQRAMQKQRIKEMQERKKRFKNRLIILAAISVAVAFLMFEIKFIMSRI